MKIREILPGVAAVAVAAQLTGGASAQAVSDADAIKAATAAFFAALSARDINAIDPLWSQAADVVSISPYGQSVAVGWPAARQDIVASFTGLAQFAVTFTPASTHIDQNEAWVAGTSKVHLVVQNGPTMDYTAFDTTMLQKVNGKWLIVGHVASPVLPPPGPPPAK
jgi:ketosteroid isomerase-like protein